MYVHGRKYPANYSGLEHLHWISGKKWWICSKLIIEKRKMEAKCVLRARTHAHVDAIMRISVPANTIAHPLDRPRLDFGLAEKARFEWENRTAVKVKFAMETIVDFCNRSCRYIYIRLLLIAQFTFVLNLSRKKTLQTHTISPNIRWMYVLK